MTDETLPMENETQEGSLKGRVEAVLFVAGEAVRVDDLAKALQVPLRQLEGCLDEMRDEYDFAQRGFCLRRFFSLSN